MVVWLVAPGVCPGRSFVRDVGNDSPPEKELYRNYSLPFSFEEAVHLEDERPPPATLMERLCSPSPQATTLVGSRHASGQMISRTVRAFLLLDHLIVEVHGELHCGHICIAQQFLQTERASPPACRERTAFHHEAYYGPITFPITEHVRLIFVFSPSEACSGCARLARKTPGLLPPLSAARHRSAGSVGRTRDQRVQAVPGDLAVLLRPAKSGWHRYHA